MEVEAEEEYFPAGAATPASSAPFPRILFNMSTGSGPAYAVVDCFKAEPLALRDEARREEVEESLEVNETEDDLDKLGRCCDVM